MNRLYKIGEFAQLASVTVRTLHHYDRIGLLKPQRSPSGVRVYSLTDLERLEQIAALKFLGISLSEIKFLLKSSTPLTLLDSLDFQLKALQEKRTQIDSALRAIELATQSLRSGQATDASVLKKILEIIDMQPQENFMRKYYADQAWLDREKLAKETPLEVREERARSFLHLFAEMEASLDLDPTSETAQSLTQRWLLLADASSGDNAGIRDAWTTAWKDHDNWPVAEQEALLRGFGLDPNDRPASLQRFQRVITFLGQAISAQIKTNWRNLYRSKPS
jgi:DNA-binding transcriptional MerR regulator